MKMSELKQELKDLAKEIRNAKCEVKCTNRLAYFNSYDAHGDMMGRWSWPYAGAGGSSFELTKPRKARKLWDDHEQKTWNLKDLQRSYTFKHAVYCLVRGRSLDQVFHLSSTIYTEGYFAKSVIRAAEELKTKLVVEAA